MRYRAAGTPFKVYTLMKAMSEWILTEVSHPLGDYRVRSFGDVILMTDLKEEQPGTMIIDEALQRILEGSK